MKASEDIAALLAYIPLLFSGRREKTLLLEPFWREVMALAGREVSSGDRDLYPALISLIPPQVVMELKGLRHEDRVHIDFWEAHIGKGAVDWRFLLMLEAGCDKQAKAYLDTLLSQAAAKYDARELQLFTKAVEKIERCKRDFAQPDIGRGFAQPDKAKALHYFLQRRAEGRPIKSAKEIEYFVDGHNLARILKGPILGHLKRKKAGRPSWGK